MKVIDFEVFKHDWLCVILDFVTLDRTVIVNDKEALTSYYEQNRSDVFIGYNIRGYDQWIFKGILCGFNPKEINDHIIKDGLHGSSFSSLLKEFPLYFYDAKTTMESLKTLEGFMGSDICESTVPFDIDRKLTSGEIEEVIEYCIHDVMETYKVFFLTQDDFTSHVELIKMFGLNKSDLGLTKARLGARILNARKLKKHDDAFKYVIPSNLRIERYTSVVKWFKDVPKLEGNPYKQKLKLSIAGAPHTLGWGGIHGAIKRYHETGIFINVDVASYYPSMMVHYGYISRAARNPERFTDSYHSRLKYKAEKNPKQKPLKLFLNTGYGVTKDKYNPLYDPLVANNICVTGQLLLIDLIERVENSGCADLVQSNTDGVLFKLRGNSSDEFNHNYFILDDVCYEWEQRTKMTLEFEEFTEVWQKDVNNYLVKNSSGGYKSKGAYVKELSPLDNDLPIVNKAMVDYMLAGTPIDQTINECNDLIMFQKILKVSKKYDYAEHNGKRRAEKTFRVFASLNPDDSTLFKVREGERKARAKFGHCPDHCFIDNSDMRGKGVPMHLDKEYYIKLAKKRLSGFSRKELP